MRSHLDLNKTGITRPFNPQFWQDRYIRTLDLNTKMVYLFLITSHKVNLSGVYEISAEEIARYALCDATATDAAYAALDTLKEDGKILYEEGWIFLLNRMKHQNFNRDMKVGLLRQLDEVAGLIPISFDAKLSELRQGVVHDVDRVSTRRPHPPQHPPRKGIGRGRGRVIGRVSDAKSPAAPDDVSDTHNPFVGNKTMGDAFDRFWKVYPKKVHMQEAQMMFDQHWKTIEPAMGKILEFISKATGTNRWRETKYIPDPANFLEDKRWNDNPEDYGTEKKRIHLKLGN